MSELALRQIKAEKRAFEIGFILSTKHQIILTNDHPMFDKAMDVIFEQLSTDALNNDAIVNLVVKLIKG
jgi:hypothetical protein